MPQEVYRMPLKKTNDLNRWSSGCVGNVSSWTWSACSDGGWRHCYELNMLNHRMEYLLNKWRVIISDLTKTFCSCARDLYPTDSKMSCSFLKKNILTNKRWKYWNKIIKRVVLYPNNVWGLHILCITADICSSLPLIVSLFLFFWYSIWIGRTVVCSTFLK